MKKPKEIEAPEAQPRFLGDPSHTQYLLSDPERRNDAIKYAAQYGWERFAGDNGAPFSALSDLEKWGLFAMVTSIVSDPLAEPYASFMPRNTDQDSVRALDDSLRDILGFARFGHR